MICLYDRQKLAHGIEAARQAGVRLDLACDMAGISPRSLQCWKACSGLTQGSGWPTALRPRLASALNEAERAEFLSLANSPRFSDMPSSRIVPMPADGGIYLGSESTLSCLLRELGQCAHRGRAKAQLARRRPTKHIANAPQRACRRHRQQ